MTSTSPLSDSRLISISWALPDRLERCRTVRTLINGGGLQEGDRESLVRVRVWNRTRAIERDDFAEIAEIADRNCRGGKAVINSGSRLRVRLSKGLKISYFQFLLFKKFRIFKNLHILKYIFLQGDN